MEGMTFAMRNMSPCAKMMYENTALLKMSGKYTHPPRILKKYGLLTKREVKMAGYWPSSFFACLWTDTKSRSINTQKKKKHEANIQPF